MECCSITRWPVVRDLGDVRMMFRMPLPRSRKIGYRRLYMLLMLIRTVMVSDGVSSCRWCIMVVSL